MRMRSLGLAPAERKELVRERDLLNDLTLLLGACPDLPWSAVLDTALALHDGSRGEPMRRTRQ